MVLRDAVGVLPVARGESELGHCGDALGRGHETGASLGRDANVNDVESDAKHATVEGAVALHIERDVVVVVGSNDVIVDMDSQNVLASVRLSSITGYVERAAELSNDPAVPVGVARFVIQDRVGRIKVNQSSIGYDRSIDWVQAGHNWDCRARLSQIISV